VWWGVEQYRFPYLSVTAKQILVIQGSSAESERHFSTAGKVTRKDTEQDCTAARLKRRYWWLKA